MRRRLSTPLADPERRSQYRKWTRCCAGEFPAEALTPRDREDLVARLHELGWTDVQIAEHTRQSTYTTARIRDRIGLPPNGKEDADAPDSHHQA